ncbi:sigma-70 family RNA polymerase sigma factor [Bacillus sp. FJAT-18017]|uniref:sigma-70 family RNA polymerase sigma factor n=1 Tax=Bacillus sp. FJAT-18017 TaxID=1705566 RepID=UPI0006AF6123|nr:sigma-70 family RNA polymerase sigma factor [Bacillus sp. FJAT-18017]
MFLTDKDTLKAAQQNEAFLNDLLQSSEAFKFVKYSIKEYTKSPAKFMAVNKVEWEDLLQASYIGLFNAIRRMDLRLSQKEWVKYAFLTIKGELRNFSRSNDSNMIVISQRIRELYPKYKKFHEEYWVKHQTDPTIQDTMEYFNISKDDAFDLVYGMQEIIYQESARKRASLVAGEPAYQFRAKAQSVEDLVVNNILVKMYLDFVNEKQRKVIYLHYFKGFSKTEVSRIMGCSPAMVTKHLTTAFDHIRRKIG